MNVIFLLLFYLLFFFFKNDNNCFFSLTNTNASYCKWPITINSLFLFLFLLFCSFFSSTVRRTAAAFASANASDIAFATLTSNVQKERRVSANINAPNSTIFPTKESDTISNRSTHRVSQTVITTLEEERRSSQHWWSGRLTTARYVLHLRSLIWGFGESCIRLFTASLHRQPGCSQACAIDIFVDLQPVGLNLKGGRPSNLTG